ncbi:hypothetical protein IQ266_24685 [filamentous cyanobacterium LEGE 11480]|uniref:Uncharacterized protein n=1 Tax=Romeriopsis navalis LEGE 11480 TaxID=2777977 RepID=A0A928VSH5_9CYAN|nr:hypothetical protein [Romeriopsis navalis LEGE 11480]
MDLQKYRSNDCPKPDRVEPLQQNLFWSFAATLFIFLLGISSVEVLIRPAHRSLPSRNFAQSEISITKYNLTKKALIDC